MSDTLASLLGAPTPEKNPKKKGKDFDMEASDEVIPEKPQWVLDSEIKSGVPYEWDAMKKGWRPIPIVR